MQGALPTVAISPQPRGTSFDIPHRATPSRTHNLGANRSGRLSLDSQLGHRTDSSVVVNREGVHEVVQLLPQNERTVNKTTTRIAKRLRNMLRSLFAFD